MNKERWLWTAIALLLAICVACGTPEAMDPADVDWDDHDLYAQGLIEGERTALAAMEGATVYHMDLSIPASLTRLEGHQQVRYTNREAVSLEAIYLRLYPNLTGGEIAVSEVTVDGHAVTPDYEYGDSALRVPLPTPLAPGEQCAIEMDFATSVPTEMGGNYGLFGYYDGVLVLDTAYPAVAVHDDGAWQVGYPSRNGDITYYDASLYVVRVEAPAKLTLVASGVAVDRERSGSRQSVTFAAGPARDFYLAASSRFTEVKVEMGETTVRSYASRGHEERARLALSAAAQALAVFGERFGPYPYTEFEVVSTPMLALGIEYPGMTGISLRLYDPAAEINGTPSQFYLEPVVVHEVAHQWFYNAVGNDQVNQPWVDEAIVQYVVWLYYLDTYGERAASGYRDSWVERWDRVEGAAIPIGLPTGGYEGKEYGAIVYGRGPLFVEALAAEMGQDTFDAFLRDYYQSYKWEIGTADAFRELAETHCACDLSALFEEWVYAQ
jgi:aminopeptidase N